jgi:hypothetical protein
LKRPSPFEDRRFGQWTMRQRANPLRRMRRDCLILPRNGVVTDSAVVAENIDKTVGEHEAA